MAMAELAMKIMRADRRAYRRGLHRQQLLLLLPQKPRAKPELMQQRRPPLERRTLAALPVTAHQLPRGLELSLVAMAARERRQNRSWRSFARDRPQPWQPLQGLEVLLPHRRVELQGAQ